MQELEIFTRTWQILGNHLLVWVLAAAIFLAVYVVAPRLRGLTVGFLSRHAVNRFDVVMSGAQSLTGNTRRFFIAAIALYFASQVLVLPAPIMRMISGTVLVATVVQVGIWSSILVGLWINNGLLDKHNPDPARSSAAQVIRVIALAVVWSSVLLLTLSNFGIDITALVAGLGVGGIAIAFALQSLLKDLFASLSILLDKPFVVGDFIIFDEHLGTVEMIGLRTTRLRSLSGEQLSVSNDALLNTRLRNFKRMTERRMLFSLHAQYGASIDVLQEFPAYLRSVIEAMPEARFDRSHLAEFNELGVRFETVYYVLSPEYLDYMNAHQKVLLAAARWFEDRDMRFAQPSRHILGSAAVPPAAFAPGGQ